jgi:OOP family OmpA-OmpF porin
VSDSDGDGIPDNRDLCAKTPRGARVNASGCVDKLVVQNLVFATNKAELQDESKAQLSEVVEKIKGNPAIRGMTITGHTDDRGAAAYNQHLSEQRAQAVRNHFIERGIDGNMVRAFGKGESEPVADNGTAAGRAQNRRVEIDFRMQE